MTWWEARSGDRSRLGDGERDQKSSWQRAARQLVESIFKAQQEDSEAWIAQQEQVMKRTVILYSRTILFDSRHAESLGRSAVQNDLDA